MSFPRNSRVAAGVAAALLAACNQASTQPHGLSSFHVTVQDLSGQLGSFPPNPVAIQVSADALDEDGNPFAYSGTAVAYVTPGNTMQAPPNQYTVAANPSQYPTLQFTNGHAQAKISAWHVFGDTAIWVEAHTTDTGDYATGISDPDLLYGYPLLSELQVTTDNTKDPLQGNYVVIDQTKGRCVGEGAFGSPPRAVTLDGGTCDPSQQHFQDLMVTAVQSDGFYAMDRNSYYLDPDAGFWMPQSGFDPNTQQYDLPGSWACMFVYNYDAPNLFMGQRLVTLSGTVGEFDGDTQMSFPAWTVNSDPQFANPNPADVPPPLPIDPRWCSKGSPGDHLADQYVCAPGTDNLQFESLESCLVVAKNVTLPKRWLNCDITGTGKIPYRTASGCMPSTNGNFCGEPGASIKECREGSECVANECLAKCSTSADCVNNNTEQEACVDGHCQNACMCLEYCNSDIECNELSEYNGYGQYNGYIPGEQYPDGGQHAPWKIGFVTRNGAPELNPQTMGGMVVDVAGMLNQVRAADPMWEVDPRIQADVCCHSGSPGCGPDAGNPQVPVCPQPAAAGS